MTVTRAVRTKTPLTASLIKVFPLPEQTGSVADLIRERVFKPRKDVEAVSLPEVIDWESADRRVDRNWRMQLQGWMMLAPIMGQFDECDDKQLVLDYFLSIAKDWWKNYGADPDDIVTSRMPSSYAWYDMSVGFRALIISFFLDRAEYFSLSVSDADRDFLDDLVRKHIRHLANPAVFSLNNHGIFQMHGLLALIETSGIAGIDDEKSYAKQQMVHLLAAQFDERGIHLEHSPHYHVYALKMFDGALSSGWYADMPEFTGRLALANDAVKWLVDPLKRPICVGDSVLTVQRQVRFPEDQSDGIVISDFDESGYAALRSGWSTPPEDCSMVFLMGAYHSKTHKHRDCLSFDWFEKGQRIICDGGKYGYSSDIYRHYALSYAAHNNIQFDGLDIIKLAPYGSAIEANEELAGGIFLMVAALRTKAITHIRRLFIKPGHWIVVEDELAQQRGREIAQRWHLDNSFQLRSLSDNRMVAEVPGGPRVSIRAFGWEPKAELFYGSTDPVQGYSFRKDLVVEPALALSYSGFVKDKQLITVLSLSDEDEREARDFCSIRFDIPMGQGDTVSDDSALLPGVPHNTVDSPSDLLLKKAQRLIRSRLVPCQFRFMRPFPQVQNAGCW